MASNLLADMLVHKLRFNVVAALIPTEVLPAVSGSRPDIVVLSADVDRDPARGIEITRKLNARSPEVRTIILADSCDRELVVAAFRAGARGIYCRTDPLANFGKCIQRVHENQIWADSRQINFLVEALIATAPYLVVDARGNELLSERELEVVQLAVRGYTNSEIADKMGLSEHTVKNYIFRTFEKLGVSNRVEMLFYVLAQSGTGRSLPSVSAPSANSTSIGELQAAAEAGSISAQLELATKYRHGTGVGKNPAYAYFWLRVAEERAKDIGEQSRTALRRLASHISPDESEPIERRISEWLNAHLKKAVKGADAPKKTSASA
jgi:two-component system nitrate/nitrite response regulator NarL